MERKGCIMRQSIAEDARMKKIVIMPPGLSFQKQVQEDLAEMDTKITRGISDEDRECFFRVAEIMLKICLAETWINFLDKYLGNYEMQGGIRLYKT